MAYFGVDSEVRITELNLQFKNRVRQMKSNSLRRLKTIFRKFDTNNNGLLEVSEFEEALASFGLFPKIVDLKSLHKYYDREQVGGISYDSFVSGLSDPTMSFRKTLMVNKLWNCLDTSGSGEIKGCDANMLLDDAKLGEFLEMFDATEGGNQEGIISKADFEQCYKEMSTQLPQDEFFIKHCVEFWGVPEDASNSVDDQQVKEIIKRVRQRLITISNNNQEEYTLRNIFRKFDYDSSGAITATELGGMVASLGVEVQDHELIALMRFLDKNNSNTVEFEEFCEFMIIDPYK